MRFNKIEGHFKTRQQALAEIAAAGWHPLEKTFSAEDELHGHDFDAVALSGFAQPVLRPLYGRL